jgi:biotin transport system substrate-specific component
MALTLTTPNTLIGVLQPKTDAARIWTNVATVVLGTVLLTLSAKISVPVQPIPVTLQTLAVALIAASLGWRMAVATVALYLIEGLAGLPVFASGGGIGYVFRPSFGFLVGYLPMAALIGWACDRGASRNLFLLFGAMVLGDAIAFLFGFGWLMVVINMIVNAGAELPSWPALDPQNLVGTAYEGAVAPFILWDLIKMAFAAITIAGVWTLFRRKA